MIIIWHHQPCAAGCVAAGAGFLLNFTIREHPLNSRDSTGTAASGTRQHLAPDQHRLTDDGEASKSSSRKSLLSSDTTVPVGNSMAHSTEGQNGHQNGLVEDAGVSQTTVLGPQPLTGAMAQIKVALSLQNMPNGCQNCPKYRMSKPHKVQVVKTAQNIGCQNCTKHIPKDRSKACSGQQTQHRPGAQPQKA